MQTDRELERCGQHYNNHVPHLRVYSYITRVLYKSSASFKLVIGKKCVEKKSGSARDRTGNLL